MSIACETRKSEEQCQRVGGTARVLPVCRHFHPTTVVLARSSSLADAARAFTVANNGCPTGNNRFRPRRACATGIIARSTAQSSLLEPLALTPGSRLLPSPVGAPGRVALPGDRAIVGGAALGGLLPAALSQLFGCVGDLHHASSPRWTGFPGRVTSAAWSSIRWVPASAITCR